MEVGYPGILRSRCLTLVAGALLASSACGRIGFDGTSSTPSGDDAGGPDACAPGSCEPFQPAQGTCTQADSGPFAQVATFPTQGGGYGVWAAPPYVLVADTTGGLRSLRLDGTTFTEVGELQGIGWVEAVISDGTHYYVGAPGTGLAVVRVAATGDLTLITQETNLLTEARRAWPSDGLLYVPSGGDGLFAYRFDGTTLTRVGSRAMSMSWAQGVWASGTRVLFADAGVFRVVDFDGTSFTDYVTPNASHNNSSRVWSDNTNIFVANEDGLTAFRLSGATLVELDTFPTPGGAARDVWSDGQHVFVAAEGSGVYALRFDGTSFTLLDQVDTGDQALGVFGDGNYIYTNDLTGGLRAYGGFTCRSW